MTKVIVRPNAKEWYGEYVKAMEQIELLKKQVWNEERKLKVVVKQRDAWIEQNHVIANQRDALKKELQKLCEGRSL